MRRLMRILRRLGFTLDEVAELLDTGRRRHPTADLRQRATDKIAEIDRKIADLTAIRGTLVELVDARCDSLTHCTCADCPLPFAELANPELANPEGDPA
jgi:DNA-binding transcriptional MerR regulator